MELRKNEETGAVEKQVITYETVEREGLQGLVTSKEAELEAVTNAGNELQAQVEANQADRARLESELTDAKSGLEKYDSIAGVEPEPVQPDATPTDTENAGEVEATEVSSDVETSPVQF